MSSEEKSAAGIASVVTSLARAKWYILRGDDATKSGGIATPSRGRGGTRGGAGAAGQRTDIERRAGAARAGARRGGTGGAGNDSDPPERDVDFGAGSNITVHLGEDGVILVDAGTAALAPQVVTAVKALAAQPIRLIVNTSADAITSTGNEIVSVAGREVNPDAFSEDPHATVLAHENVMLRMSTPSGTTRSPDRAVAERDVYGARAVDVSQQRGGAGAPACGRALRRRQRGAVRKADVIATGDILDLRHFPVIDPAQGGSIQGELDALNRLLELTVPAMPLVLKPGRTLLVPGHGRVSDYAELVEYRTW